MAEARALLIALYEDPSVTTDEKREAPHVLFNDLHDRDDAVRITREVYTRGTGDTVKAGSDYAMMLLLSGHHDQEAAAVIAQIEASGRVNNDDPRSGFGNCQSELRRTRQADLLRERGTQRRCAWDKISALLAERPNDPVLLMAVAGRIYASAGRNHDALDYFDKAYQQDSGNIDVIKGVVQGAILAHDTGQAQTYLDKGMEIDAQNPWLYFLKAQIAEARGNRAEALEALRTARSLNQQKMAAESPMMAPGVTPRGPASATSPTQPSPGVSPAPAPPPNPFRRLRRRRRRPRSNGACRSVPWCASRPTARGSAMKPSTRALTLGLLLTAVVPSGVVFAADPSAQILLERAKFWQLHERFDLAAQMIDKVLALDPAQPDALYQAVLLARQRGDDRSAQAYVDRLRRAAPADRRLAALAAPSSAATVAVVRPMTIPLSVAEPAKAATPSGSAKAVTVPGAPELAAVSADSDDLKPAVPVQSRAALTESALGSAVIDARISQVAALPVTTISDGDTNPAVAAPVAAGGDGVTARKTQVTQLELMPPLPVGGYQRPFGAPYSPDDTLEDSGHRSQSPARSSPKPIRP